MASTIKSKNTFSSSIEENTVTYDNFARSHLAQQIQGVKDVSKLKEESPSYKTILERVNFNTLNPEATRKKAWTVFILGILFLIIGIKSGDVTCDFAGGFLIFGTLLLAHHAHHIAKVKAQIAQDKVNGYDDLKSLYQQVMEDLEAAFNEEPIKNTLSVNS